MNREQEQFLRDNVKGKTRQELADLLEKKFGKKYTVHQIKYYKQKLGLKSGINGQFQAKRTPHNKKPIGTEFVDERGYIHIKIGEPNEWVMKHRYIYEKRNGKIPKGYSVVFADSDKTNFSDDNLILMRDKDKLVMNSLGLFIGDKELAKTGYLLAQVINKRCEIERGN